MTPRVRTAACLIACAVSALIGAADVAAAERRPAPEGLWQMYPLDQTGGGQRSRPTGAQRTATTETEPSATPEPRTAPSRTTPPPTSGVAGTSATITAAAADPAAEASGDGGSSLTVALLLGLFAASIILLALAALPQSAVPVLGERVTRHRTDLAIAAALSLLALAVVFLAGAV